jgi:hypothetical protein
MIDALPRRKKLLIVSLVAFALLASMLGASPLAVSAANAAVSYGGVRLVDSEGDPLARAIVFLSDMGLDLPVRPNGTARLSDSARPDASGESIISISYYPIGGAWTPYIWDGSALVEDDGSAVAATVNFDSSSSTLLTLTAPVDQPDGSISGTRSLNPPASGVVSSVSVYTTDFEWVTSTWTDPDGSYALPALPAGTYKLQFSGNVTGPGVAYNYVSRWYQDKRTVDTATAVTVGSSAVTGVDQTLQATGEVRGVLGPDASDLEGPVVGFIPSSWGTEVPDWDSPEIEWAQVFENKYEVDLAAGSYRVAFGNRVTGESSGWDVSYDFTPLEYWDGASSLSTSKVLTIGAGGSKTVNGLGAPTFSDVAAGSQFEFEITWLASTGITTGYPDGGFHPLSTVNRDAMAAFLYRFAGSPAFTPPTVSPFWDVPKTNQFYKEITWLASTGVTTGYPDGSFRPLGTVNRDAMAAFLFRFAQSPSWWTAPATSPFTDVPTSNQFYKEITWLAYQGISTGYTDGTFRPLGTVNRDAMAAFLYRFPAWLIAE